MNIIQNSSIVLHNVTSTIPKAIAAPIFKNTVKTSCALSQLQTSIEKRHDVNPKQSEEASQTIFIKDALPRHLQQSMDLETTKQCQLFNVGRTYSHIPILTIPSNRGIGTKRSGSKTNILRRSKSLLKGNKRHAPMRSSNMKLAFKSLMERSTPMDQCLKNCGWTQTRTFINITTKDWKTLQERYTKEKCDPQPKKCFMPTTVRLPVPKCTPRPKPCPLPDLCDRADDCRKVICKNLPPIPTGPCLCVEPFVPTKTPRMRRPNLFVPEPRRKCPEKPCPTYVPCRVPKKKLRPYVPKPCPCIEPPPMIDVKLKRLPKPCPPDNPTCEPERICPKEVCNWPNEDLCVVPKTLPPLEPKPCPCIEPPPMTTPKFKRINVKAPEPPRVCPCEPEVCPCFRADENLCVVKKKLAPITPGDCPCIDRPMTDVNFKRLECEEYVQPCDPEDPCIPYPRADYGCWEYYTPEVDKCKESKEEHYVKPSTSVPKHRTYCTDCRQHCGNPVPKRSILEKVENMDVFNGAKRKLHTQINFIKSMGMTQVREKHRGNTKPPWTCNDVDRKTYIQPDKCEKQYECDLCGDEEDWPETRTILDCAIKNRDCRKISIPDLTLCECPVATKRRCCKREQIFKCCKKIPAPYRAFTDCVQGELYEELSECPITEERVKELQPSHPILTEIPLMEPTVPELGKIDLAKEDECIRNKLCMPKRTLTQDCTNFGETIKPLRQRDLFPMKDQYEECIEIIKERRAEKDDKYK